MRKSEIINLLNKDLTGEIEAILVYMRDSFVTPQCEPSRTMEEIAKDEMRHAEKLAELIVDIGGIPSMQHRELDFGQKGVKGYLKKLISLEQEAIAMYKEHIAVIPNIKIKKTLTHILHEEEEHLEEFEEQLKAIS
ncbi:MAG: ferritin-like domain-containing protein [Nitrospirota bacterium]